MNISFDSIIIGAGQAGPSLAGRLTRAGEKIAFIERNQFGGTCVNTGCTPTKAMVASAHAAHIARRAGDFGVRVDGAITVDMKAVKERKDSIVSRSRTSVESWVRGMDNCAVYHEHARFISSHGLSVGNDLLSADKIFVNVGARPSSPKFPGIDSVPYLTSSSILDLDRLPSHLVIVGGGYIGLEFGQMFRRFGSQVTIVEMGPRLVKHEDPDVSQAILEILESEGIQFRLNAECISLFARGTSIGVNVSCIAGEPEVIGSDILLAVGRVPNTGDLGLEHAGVATNMHGYIIVDDELKTNIPGIWALGDCNIRGGFTHTSYNDFEIVAANVLDNERRRVSDRISVHALFIDPPLGQIGLTEEEVRQSGRPALISVRPMSRVARAIEKGETAGFMKVLVDAETKRILGASILGTGGDEAIHCILDTMYADEPYTTLKLAMHIHPTVSELIPTLLGDLRPLV